MTPEDLAIFVARIPTAIQKMYERDRDRDVAITRDWVRKRFYLDPMRRLPIQESHWEIVKKVRRR